LLRSSETSTPGRAWRDHPVAVACQARIEPEFESSGHDQEGIAGSLAPIHLNRRYIFRDSGQVIDLNAIVAGLNLT
jgi:hypothetical protein